ncbi:MAG TPA: hypothetical protein VN886_23215, partial [Acidimicrobiales bacterium]|nr:hypothetical protein [Acidimicrobiales bacterium]
VLWASEGQTLVEAGRGDPPGGVGNGSDGSQHPAGDKPTRKKGEYGDNSERDGRVHQQLVRVGRTLRSLDRACLGQLMHRLRQVIGGQRQLVLVLCQARFQGGDWPGEERVTSRRQGSRPRGLSEQILDANHLTLVICHRSEGLWEREVLQILE